MGSKKRTMDFSSKENYEKWLGYGHVNHLFKHGNVNIEIRGKKHKVEHGGY